MLERAVGINDAGQIVGDGTRDGIRHSFLLTPVPEPSTLALLALVGTSLGVRLGVRRLRSPSLPAARRSPASSARRGL